MLAYNVSKGCYQERHNTVVVTVSLVEEMGPRDQWYRWMFCIWGWAEQDCMRFPHRIQCTISNVWIFLLLLEFSIYCFWTAVDHQ
jgi:hypothetical protein